MRRAARLDPDQTGRQLGGKRRDLPALEMPAQLPTGSTGPPWGCTVDQRLPATSRVAARGS